MKKFIEKCLASDAKRLLAKAKPKIIGVTGSVGKSTAKQAIAAVLAAKFVTGSSPGNYNTEVGLPLAVLGLRHPGRSPLGWLKTLTSAFFRPLGSIKDYPQLFVLEMAADKPGDIDYLTGIALPDVAVVTAVGESHAQNFGSVEKIAAEKGILVERTRAAGVAILNRDDEKVWAMRLRTKARVVSYGLHESADVRATDLTPVVVVENIDSCGMRFKVSAKGSTVPMLLPGVVGTAAVYAALAAVAVGIEQGMNLVEIAEGLKLWQPAPGRMRCLAGIKRALLIDDTYNSAPLSCQSALLALRDLPFETGHAKFAVLGDMLELGPLSVSGHESVGRLAFQSGADYLVFVGERMRDGARAAKEAGAAEDRVYSFGSTDEAGRFVQEKMHQGDVVLIKGSRGSHMEAITKELMADPLAAEHLLVH